MAERESVARALAEEPAAPSPDDRVVIDIALDSLRETPSVEAIQQAQRRRCQEILRLRFVHGARGHIADGWRGDLRRRWDLETHERVHDLLAADAHRHLYGLRGLLLQRQVAETADPIATAGSAIKSASWPLAMLRALASHS